MTALTFLAINGFPIEIAANETDDPLYNAMIGIANRTVTREDLAELFRKLAIDSLIG